MLVPELSDEVETIGCIRKMQTTLQNKIAGDEALKCLTMSIGISFGVRNGADYEALFSNADNSVLYVKNKGKNDFHFYSPLDEKQEEKKGR